MKSLIIYKGKYGATKQYATWLGNDLQAPVMEADDVIEENLTPYDTIIIGASVYVGKLQLRDWLKKFAQLLAAKNVHLFIVCATPASEKQKVAEIIQQNIPLALIRENNIHILPGRLVKKKLSMADRFILKMGALLQKDPEARANMLRDFDEVKEENLLPLMKAVQVARPERKIIKMFV